MDDSKYSNSVLLPIFLHITLKIFFSDRVNSFDDSHQNIHTYLTGLGRSTFGPRNLSEECTLYTVQYIRIPCCIKHKSADDQLTIV